MLQIVVAATGVGEKRGPSLGRAASRQMIDVLDLPPAYGVHGALSNAFGPSYSGHASFPAALTVMEVRHWRASMRIHRLFGFVLVFLITLTIPALHGQETPVTLADQATSEALSPKNANTLQSDVSKANQDLLAGKNKQASNDFADFIKDVTKIMRKGGLA